MGSSGVRAYVAQVDRLLASGEGLFPRVGQPGAGALTAGGSEVATAPPGVSGLAAGSGGVADGYRATWTRAAALDDDGNAAARAADRVARNGRTGASAVRHSAQSAAAAIGRRTDSPAGIKELVSTMDQKLADMQRLVDTTRARNQPLAARLQALTAGYDALPTAHVPPKPPPPTLPAPSMCWIGTADGDVHRLCPADTDTVTYVDDDGNYVAKSLPGGEITIMHRPGPLEGDPTVCWLPHAGADRSICGPAATSWMYPAGGVLVTEETGSDGKVHVVYQTPPGPLAP